MVWRCEVGENWLFVSLVRWEMVPGCSWISWKLVVLRGGWRAVRADAVMMQDRCDEEEW